MCLKLDLAIHQAIGRALDARRTRRAGAARADREPVPVGPTEPDADASDAAEGPVPARLG